jgi:hypothetical protein
VEIANVDEVVLRGAAIDTAGPHLLVETFVLSWLVGGRRPGLCSVAGLRV